MSDTTSHDPPVPDGIDGAQLKRLRQAAGMDPTVLAIRTSLSKHQVLQIENGGHDLFYNVSIKRACARKLAVALGIDPDGVVADLPAAPADTVQASTPAAPLWPAAVPLGTDRRRIPLKIASAVVMLAVLTLGLTQLHWVLGTVSPSVQPWRDGSSWMPQWNPPWSTAQVPANPPVAAAQVPALAAETTPATQARMPDDNRPVQIAANPPLGILAPAQECPVATDDSPVVQPLKAFKAGQMVFVQALADQHLCLRDHSGQVWSVSFKAGQERSFMGSPPWTVQSAALSQFNVFFQGWRLRLPEGITDSVRIVELQR